MSYEIGFLKYILFTPLSIVGAMSMYAYGGGIVTLFSTIHHILSGGFIEAFIEYFVTSALPPASIEHVVFQIIVGSVAAGIKWYLAVAVFR